MSFLDDQEIRATNDEADVPGTANPDGVDHRTELRSTSPSLNDNGDTKIYSLSFRESGCVLVQEQSKEEFANHILTPQRPLLTNVQNGQKSPELPIQQRDRPLERSALAQSLPARSYTNPGRKRSAPTIYCIHGNTFGVARCCGNLDTNGHGISGGGGPSHHSSISEINNSTSPSVDISETAAIIEDPNCLCHDAENPGHSVDKKAQRKLLTAAVLCLIFMTLEAIGGILAGSLAIASDAAHLLTDFASLMVSLFAVWLAGRPPSRSMSWGWHRAEMIGATVSVLMIWVVTGILVYAAVLRVQSGEYEIDTTIMLITSSVGVVVNIIMGMTLHQGHGHGRGHGGGGDEQNVNVRAAFIHVVGDFISSLGVLVAALVIYFKPEYKIVDPICTFIFSVLVLGTTIRILRDTMNVLMGGLPKGVDFQVVREVFLSVDGIVAVHNLRIWALTTNKTALSAHLAIRADVDEQKALKEASAKIRTKYNIYGMTFQLERFHDRMKDCNACKPPEK